MQHVYVADTQQVISPRPFIAFMLPTPTLHIEGYVCAGHAAAAVEVANPTDRPISAAPVEPAIAPTPAEQLNWLPATCAAVSLRLFAIDSAIIYRPGDQPGRETLQVCIRWFVVKARTI